MSLASQWEVSGFLDQNNRVETCLALTLGGPALQLSEGFMERTYTGISPHSIIYYSIVAIFGGTWLTSDTISIQFDDHTPSLLALYPVINNRSPTNVCPKTASLVYQAFKYFIVGKAFHTSDSITFRISWNTQGSGSIKPFIGIHDLVLSFAKRTATDVEEMCISIGDTSIPRSTYCPTNSI